MMNTAKLDFKFVTQSHVLNTTPPSVMRVQSVAHWDSHAGDKAGTIDRLLMVKAELQESGLTWTEEWEFIGSPELYGQLVMGTDALNLSIEHNQNRGIEREVSYTVPLSLAKNERQAAVTDATKAFLTIGWVKVGEKPLSYFARIANGDKIFRIEIVSQNDLISLQQALAP